MPLNEVQQKELRGLLKWMAGQKPESLKQMILPLPRDDKPRESGHAPATVDNRFPRMVPMGRRNGKTLLHQQEEALLRAGGRPSKGTRKDKRLKKNKGRK